ncbi:metal ABC transporter solute-binding protein, Zn/Mn family [Neobacillus mesonae]|uniref:metal ABC transporter solute-binding protein, Zn/Mn family n=1 Tax=Neobacillus mesonae TaxID=1193713 RepID=UPI0025731082|nr:zinc ABC transporter substrate-binding protein [Neobacillus mesonae]
MKFNKLVSSSSLMLGLILAGCSNTETAGKTKEKNNKEPLTVYTTIYPLEDFTQKIGGKFVEVKNIYPPNVDAQSYEPTTKDMVNLSNSDLFIYSGVGIEGFAEKASELLKKETVTVVKAGEGIHLIKSSHSHEHSHDKEEENVDNEHHDDGHDHDAENEESHDHEADEHHHGDLDPHVWLDPILAIELATNIKTSLCELMPEHKTEFETNFNSLKSDLEKLDQEFKTTIDSSKTKYLLVSHAAYGYWEKRFGIKQIAISGLSPTQEPTQKQLKEIVDESAVHNIRYVIFEQSASPKVATIIQNELGAKSLTLHNLESITDENMKQKDDYFSIMRKNLETLKSALND